MFYKNPADELFIVPVLEDILENGNSIEIAHLQIYGLENTLCGKVSISPVGFLSSFVSSFRPCLECAEAATNMGLEPRHRNAKPIYDLDFITDFVTEPFLPDRSHRYIWKNQPLPATRVLLTLDTRFSLDEYQQLRLGFIPKEMEHKWFIYMERDWLYFHRSWSGICVYQIRLEKIENEYKVAEAWCNRDPEQYEGTGDNDYDKYVLEYLIDRLLLNKDVTFFVPSDFPQDNLKPALYFHKMIGDVHRPKEIDPHSKLKTFEQIQEAYKEHTESIKPKRDYLSEPYLSLSGFPTPIIPSTTRIDKTELLVGYASEMSQLSHLEHNVSRGVVIHYEIAVSKRASLAVVTYGVGVKSLPRKAVADIAINSIVERFDQANSTDVKTLFIEGFEAAAQKISQYNLDKDRNHQAAATCCAILIIDHRLYLASLGHCRVFWLRDQKVKQISVPHTVLEVMIDSGHIKPDELPVRWTGPTSFYFLGEGDSYPDFRLRLRPDESKEQSVANQGLQLQSGDQVFLCAAGVYGSSYLTSRDFDKIAQRLTTHSHPQETVNNFVELERQADNPSDLTVILLKVS